MQKDGKQSWQNLLDNFLGYQETASANQNLRRAIVMVPLNLLHIILRLPINLLKIITEFLPAFVVNLIWIAHMLFVKTHWAITK